MNKPYALGIDIGGGSVRCLLVNTQDHSSVSALRSWSFPVAEGSFGLGFNLNLDDMWQLIGEASREAIAKAGITGEQVGSVAVSAMRFGTVIIDKQGKALYAVPNRDARAAGEGFELAAECGEELNQETGLWPMPIHLSARIKMLMKNAAKTVTGADCVFSMGDWVNYKLCGVKATDYSQAGVTQLFNLKTREWNKARIAKLGAPISIFPEVKNSGSKLGTVNADAAQHLGLSTSTVVGLGGGDTQCSLLGAGAIKAGDIASVAGTTAPVMVVTDKPAIDAQGRTWSGQHVVPGLWVLESSGGPMGETLTWMARMMFPEAPEPELRVFAEAAQSDYGAKGLLSSLGAEVMNSRAPAMPAGQITLTHMSSASDPNPRRHMCRALIEGYASAVRANIEQLGEVTGNQYKEVYLTAGFSRSNVFAQILADINDGKVTPAGQANTSALGAVICAAVAEGKYKDMSAAVNALVKNRNTIARNESKLPAAQKVYADWIAMRNAGKDNAAKGTASQVGDHVLHYVLGSGDASAKKETHINAKLNALVTAAFDEKSLNAMRTRMEVEYANFRESKRILTGPGMVSAMQGKQILVTEVDIVDAKALSQLPDLRVVAACRGNAVNVDVDACTAFGIPVLFAPGRNSVAVADLTVAFILALARKLVPAALFLKDESVTAGNMAKMGQAFTQLQGKELWHKTIGLIGVGAVGRMVAKRLQGFEARIIAADPFATAEQAALAGVELVSLDALLRESDFVSIHAAVTPQTMNMLGKAEFAKMKKGAFFINTARAQLVDEQALIEALDNGTLAGAGLDTFLKEPPGFDHPLIKNPKVLSAPHSAGNTFEVAQHQGADVSAALLQLVNGEKPRACLNPEVLKDFSWDKPCKQPTPAEVEALLRKPPPGVTDLQRDENAGVSHGGVKTASPTALATAASPQIIANMRKLFEKFCVAMAQDQAVKKFAQDQQVTLAFNAPDVNLQFFITMDKGKVSAGLGDKDGDVQLAMRAVILDGMFNGTTDAMNAAMNGEISFMGDAAKAMTIQHLQADMERLYKAIRIEVGDPGNLAAIPKPGSAPVAVAAPASGASPQIIANMRKLFEKFCAAMTQDQAVKKFAQDQQVTLAFNAPDINLQFFITMDKGNVTAGLDEKNGDVQLAMRAVILDGMFNGTTDAMNAAMNGEISFMGDAAKAMTIQHLQADMERLYKAIRIEVGDPGDLASIPKPGSAVVSTVAVATAAVAHVEVRDQRHELLDIVNELYEHYIITATGGNVSVRCDDNPNECWITPSAVFKGHLRAEMMVRVTLDGKKVDPLSRSPSSEWGFHTLTLKKKPKANAVIHAHAPNATILANCGIPFLPISSDAAFFGDIKRIPFTMPGSDNLAELVSDALKDEWAVFMENHGIVVAGKSLRRACDMAQIIERTAEVILGCYQATGGKPPKVLPKEAVDLFRSMGDIVA
jgi:autoinducer 2 (AI-2) kinase